MSAEDGHTANRHYFDREGHLHLNGVSIYDSAETELPTVALANIQSGLSVSDTAAADMSKIVLSSSLTVSADAGNSDAGNSAFIAPVLGNVVDDGDPLTQTHNFMGGVVGLYSVTNTNASTYPVGGVLAGIGGGSTTADGAVVAYVDGEATATTAGAAFKVMSVNSNVASGFDFGLDLQDAAHDTALAVDADFYLKAPLRLVGDVVELVGTGAPTDGVTGADVAGPGSRYTNVTTGDLYRNTTAKASPTWGLSGVTLGDLGVTSSAAEINKTDGISATAYLVVSEERTFTETAVAGIYTGSVVVPAGSTIHNIEVHGIALWTNTAAHMDVGDTDADGWFAAIDLKAVDLLVGEVIDFNNTGGKQGVYLIPASGLRSASYNAGAVTIAGIVTTTGATGTAGRTRLVVTYSTPTAVAATKS